jgi:8-oxo-dGTP diphosphatase
MSYKNRELKVDIALLSVLDNELGFFLIKRPYDPFKGKWALPGGFIPDNMSADEAAKFQLEKKTGLKNVYLEQLSLFSKPNRDPNGCIASMAYLSLVDNKKIHALKTDDATELKWFKLSELKNLSIAFDHIDIIKKAQERMINKVRYTKVGFELAGKEFTIKNIIKVFEVVTGKKLDQSNVRKKMLKLNLLISTEKLIKDSPGRPSPVYKLNQKVYKNLDVGESFFN